MYSQEEIVTALNIYHQCESVTRTITTLGYPTRRALYTWIKNENIHKPPRKELCNINTANHPRNPSHEIKMSAIHRCFELGEISPSVPDLIQRDFHADKPNEKWLTDITEFSIPAGKVYLSSIVDCFDGMLPCWTIGIIPDSTLVNHMLDQAVSQLHKSEHPIRQGLPLPMDGLD